MNISNNEDKTKYQAEECVLKAREEGVPATIFRIGNLTKRASDGLFQINAETNGMAAQIRALEKLGVYPASGPFRMREEQQRAPGRDCKHR